MITTKVRMSLKDAPPMPLGVTGNTGDSDSSILGSNPGEAALRIIFRRFHVQYEA
jgi:hypothetical protein